MRELVVKELTPSLRDDFLLFFDNVAFANNPDWSDCYCSAYHFTNNQGVASQLLNAACHKFSQKGLEYAEAYPVKKPPSAAYDFPGPLSMYLKTGFSTHRDADWYLVVRKRLEKPD